MLRLGHKRTLRARADIARGASARVGPTRVARVGAGALNVREALERAGIDRSVAIHEAGHAWAAHRCGFVVRRVHASTGGDGSGWTSTPALEEVDDSDPAAVDALRVYTAAGRAAEIIWMLQGGRTDLAAIDLGATSDFAMLEADAERPGALDSITAEERAMDLLEDDWDEVIGLADHLQDHGGDLGGWLSPAVRR